MSVSRTWFPRLSAAVLLSVFSVAPVAFAESSDALNPSPDSMERQAAAQRQPSSITGVLMQARGGRATQGTFLDTVNATQSYPGVADKAAGKGDSCGNCFDARGEPGCENSECEDIVCAIDDFCCDVEWDSICAGEAMDLCGDCSGGPPPPETDCCEANGTPGCDDPTCETAVCGADAFCCDTQWDGLCAAAALELCPELCKGAPPPPPEPEILVNTDADGIPMDDGFCTLREAVMTANGLFFGFIMEGECEIPFIPKPKGFGLPPDATVIAFDPSLAGATISLTLTDVSGEGGPGPKPKGPKPPPSTVSDFFGPTALLVTSNIIIAGDPEDGIIIERDTNVQDMRLFLILGADFFECDIDKGGFPCFPCPKGCPTKGFGPGGAIEFVNVTLQGGIARGGDGGDGGLDEIMQSPPKGGGGGGGGNVTDATLEGGGGGGAGGYGGAVLNFFGFVSFENSTLNNNQAIGGNGGTNGVATGGGMDKGGSANATGGGGGGIGGDGFDGGSFGSESGEGGGTDGGTFPGDDGDFGGGGAGADFSNSGGNGGEFGGGGGGASVHLDFLEDKGDFDVTGRDAGDNDFLGGGGGGGASADVMTENKGFTMNPGNGGFGAGDGSFESGGGGAGMGGAVFNFGGQAISINSTFSGNAAIGGTGVDDPAPDPKGSGGSAQGAGLGGGIINVSGFLFMNNTTLSGNRADEGGGAVFHLEAGNLDPFCQFKGINGTTCDCGATTGIFDSVLANSLNSATDFDGDDISESCFDRKGIAPGVAVENSLIETFLVKSRIEKGGTNIITGVDPELGALGDNGGPSNTHLPLPGSPVIDAVITPTPKTGNLSVDRLRAKGLVFLAVFCEERDQRGISRIQLLECDMGSVEVLPGSITICKDTVPAPPKNGSGFPFSGDLGNFFVEPGFCTDFLDLVPDDYTVMENDPEPFFYLDSIQCQSDGPNSTWVIDVATRSVDITLWEDEIVTCTFTNLEGGTIIITKNTDVPTLELFGFNTDIPIVPAPKDVAPETAKGPGPDFTLASGASQQFDFVEPGTYTASEVDPFPLNFELVGISCDDGNSTQTGQFTATINLEPGETVECFFNNEELDAQLSLGKNAEGVPTDAFVGDQYVYHLILTNNGPGFATNVVVLDPLSPLIAFVSSACATEDPPGTVRWEVGTILAGQSLFCDFTVEILDIGIIENVAFADGDQGDSGGENEGRVIVKGATPTIPTLGPWALGLLALVLGFAGVGALRRHQGATPRGR